MLGGKSIQGLLLEVLSIVLGVLLALGVSEWQEQRSYDELAGQALDNVMRELEANQVILATIHENNAATIAAALQEDESEGEDRQFVPGVQVRSNAWDALLSSGSSNHVDYQLLLSLAETYSRQSIYVQIGMKLVDASMNMSAMAVVNNTEIDNQFFQEQFMSYFEMLLAMEENLLTTYRETRRQLAAERD